MNDEFISFCIRCHTQRVVDCDSKQHTKGGRLILRGRCPVCGTPVFHILTPGCR